MQISVVRAQETRKGIHEMGEKEALRGGVGEQEYTHDIKL